MKHPASLDDFPIGCTVKVAARPGDHAMLARYDGHIGHVEFTGNVGETFGGQLASVAFGPSPSCESMVFPIEMLERGRIEWIPEVSA